MTSNLAPLRPGGAVAGDGTEIGWHSLGEGPGLAIVHGSMQSGRSQLDLARLLAPTHQVHLLDRRGRGLSGPYPSAGPFTSLEVEDLATVLAATGARDVLGISTGALIALRAARTNPTIERVAAFEPPLAIDGSMRLDLVERFQRELAAGDLPDALVTSMLAAELGPAVMRKLPRGLLRIMTRRMLQTGPKTPDDVSVRELALALRIDLTLVVEQADRLADFSAIRAATLLLDGTRTRPYLRTAVAGLAGVIPHSRRVSLPGTDHGATQNRSDWGKPDRVAPALVEFFG